MRYIILLNDNSTFSTNWFDPENNWSDQILIVYDLFNFTFMNDGKEWNDIRLDHL